MTLPSFLLLECRVAFKLCARQHIAGRTRLLCTSPILAERNHSKPISKPSAGRVSIEESHQRKHRAEKQVSVPDVAQAPGLVPQRRDGKAVGTERRTELPMRVIPNENLTPDLKLSPRERLQIEQLTRHPPPLTKPKVYKQRLLIYSAGFGKTRWMAIVRFAAMSAVSFMTVIWLPANYFYGTPYYILALGWLASFTPMIVINWIFRPIVTQVWLNLTPTAQTSAQAAINYAKNLPYEASVDVNFMRWTMLEGAARINLADTVSAKGFLRPVNFQWIGPRVDKGGWFRSNPTEFFVKPETAKGRAARFTTPGLWSGVYKRLTGFDATQKSRWR